LMCVQPLMDLARNAVVNVGSPIFPTSSVPQNQPEPVKPSGKLISLK
jgi:hypothetical protein